MGIPSPLPLLCLCSHDLHVSKVRFCLDIVASALKHSLTSDPLRNISTKHIPAPGLTRTPSVKTAEPSSPRLTRLAPYCGKTSRIAKDHAPFCPVLYQFCLLKKLHSTAQPAQHGSEHGRCSGTVVSSTLRTDGKRHRLRGKQSAEALQARSGCDDRLKREGHREDQRQGARARARNGGPRSTHGTCIRKRATDRPGQHHGHGRLRRAWMWRLLCMPWPSFA